MNTSLKMGETVLETNVKLEELSKQLDSDSDKEKMDAMKRIISVYIYIIHNYLFFFLKDDI